MISSAANWLTQQLVAYLAELTVGPGRRASRAATLRLGAERAAEAVEAEIAAVVWDGRVRVALGFGPGQAPIAAVKAVVGGTGWLEVPGLGRCHAVAVPFSDSGQLVLGRSDTGFDRDEMILIRAMARILALSLRSVDAVTAERSLRRESEQRAREALRDPLTGLPNRGLFLDRLNEAAARARRSGQSFGVLFMDLDGFKVVNDSMGHATGDELLRAVARRIASATRAADTTARLGGDEFAVLVEESRRLEDACAVAERVRAAMAEPFPMGGRNIKVDVSIGIAIGPDGDNPPDLLLRDADLAMYQAKSESRGAYRVFSPGLRQEVVQRVELEADLRSAIGSGGLTCMYQPIVEMGVGELVGLEALVRWRHPTRGLLSPGEFLPMAESAGLIGDLDHWVLEEAFRQLSWWRRAFDAAANVNVAVNLSGAQLRWEGLPLLVERNLSEWRLPSSRVVLEITETAILTAWGPAIGILKDLKALGVRLAVDDFGTGHSSLGRLRDLPVDIMKVDRSFVSGIDADSRLRGLTSNILRMGQDLGLDVVAEGIETGAEAAVVAGAGFCFGQGYCFARPETPEDVEARFSEAGCAPVRLTATPAGAA
ncbi:MAG TPA: EAL domain-containing protein [Acidimicrobiales bacterium]|nr:EAL domain-containing protein [Acidimicrobiales bacterium]